MSVWVVGLPVWGGDRTGGGGFPSVVRPRRGFLMVLVRVFHISGEIGRKGFPRESLSHLPCLRCVSCVFQPITKVRQMSLRVGR